MANHAKNRQAPHRDPLLDELNGIAAEPEKVDELVPAPADPLDRSFTAPTSAVRHSDSLHSTKAGGKGYSVEVKGEYIAFEKGTKDKITKPYSVTVNLPNLDKALSVIKNQLLDRVLKKIHPDYVTFHTHEIVGAHPLSPETPETRNLQFMDKAALEKYVKEERVPVDCTAYADVLALREAVIDYTLNPKDFAVREERRMAKAQEEKELAALNPDLGA